MKRKKETSQFMPFVDKFDHTVVWPDGVPFPMKIENGEARFKLTQQSGGWGLLTAITGLAVSQKFGDGPGQPLRPDQMGVTVYGVRTMNNPRESGYQQEGYVSIGGKKRRAFTSSQLFLVDGQLVDVAILHVTKRGASGL